MRVRIVVANQSEARFYDSLGFARPLIPAGGLSNPSARLHERDFDSDRPGRVFDSASPPGRRRGATAHHATDGERSTRQHQIELFARRVGTELARARAAGRFDRLVLVAAPSFLGRLRRCLPVALRRQVAATVDRDLVQQPDVDVRKYMPSTVYGGATGFSPVKRAKRTARSLS